MNIRRCRTYARAVVLGFLIPFICLTVMPSTYAQDGTHLPEPGQMVYLSPAFTPAVLKGIKVFPDEPLRFDFIVDTGDTHFEGRALEDESKRLIRYFLASLTVPEDDLWVNLSPYEKDRIIPDKFGQTEMGRDLLSQDYLLKQLTASLLYPEEELGKTFWNNVFAQAQEKYGTTAVPVNTFNKVWIVPEKAVVYENGDTAFVVESRLKVMLERDYIAQQYSQNVEHGTWNIEDKKGREKAYSVHRISKMDHPDTPGDDTEVGKSGNDTEVGKSGNDTKVNKPGNDTKVNKPGNDTKVNKPGNDTKVNKPGNDTKVNKPGNDTKVNKPGEDTESVSLRGATRRSNLLSEDRIAALPAVARNDTIVSPSTRNPAPLTLNPESNASDDIMREIILPEIEREVNEGTHFAKLRQIYHSLILAEWFRRNLRESLLGQVYLEQNKIDGVDIEDKQAREKIYGQYLAAFKQGVYDVIKEDYDTATQQMIPRKYFSGGIGFQSSDFSGLARVYEQRRTVGDGPELANQADGDILSFGVNLDPIIVASPVANNSESSEKGLSVLDDMFAEQDSGRVRVFSQEEELQETFIPAVLEHVPEKTFIMQHILRPLTDQNQIDRRGDFIEALIQSGSLEEIVKLKNDGRLIKGSIDYLFADSGTSQHDTLPIITAYRHGHEEFRDGVIQALTALMQGRTSLEKLVEKLSAMEAPIAQDVVRSLRADLELISPFDRDYFMEGDSYASEQRNIEDIRSTISRHLIQVGALSEMAHIADKDNYGQAEFDPNRPAGYVGGWNFANEKPKADQEVNDSPADKPIVVFTGSNNGGKSFTLIQNFYMQLLAQSFRVVPAQAGNFVIYDSFLFLDRAVTEAKKGLSAGGSDIKHWVEALTGPSKKRFTLVDEGFSTTATEDAYYLLMGASESTRLNGGRFMAAIHNEMLIRRLVNNPDIAAIYHFPIEMKDGRPVIDERGNLKFTWKMTPGPGDAHTLDVAEALGFPPDLIAVARAYLAGERPTITPPASRTYPPVESYTDEERARRMLLDQSPSVFNYGDYDNRAFQLLSEDSDFRDALVTGERIEPYEGGWNLLTADMRRRFLLTLLTQNESLSSEEILERQRMFFALSQNDRFNELKDVANRVFWAVHLLPLVKSPLHKGLFYGFNTIFASQEDEYFSFKQVLTFYRMNKKLLGEDFPPELEELFSRLESADRLLKAQRAYKRAQDIGQMQARQREDYDDDITDPDLVAEYLRLAEDEPNRDKWGGKLTRRRISEYLAWVKGNDERKFSAIRYRYKAGEELGALIHGIMRGYESFDVFDTYGQNERDYLDAESVRQRYFQLADEEPDALRAKWGNTVNQHRIMEYEEYLRAVYADDEETREKNTEGLGLLINTISRLQEALALKDPEIREIFDEAFGLEGADNGRVTPSRIEKSLKDLVVEAHELGRWLPKRSAFEVDLSLVAEEIGILAGHYRVWGQGKDLDRYQSIWGRDDSLIAIMVLDMMINSRNDLQDFLDMLRGYDSVDLHQYANHLEEQFRGLVSVADEIGEEPYKLGAKSILEAVRPVAFEHQDMLEEFHQIQATYGQIPLRHPIVRWTKRNKIPQVMTIIKNFETEDRYQLHKVVEAYFQLKEGLPGGTLYRSRNSNETDWEFNEGNAFDRFCELELGISQYALHDEKFIHTLKEYIDREIVQTGRMEEFRRIAEELQAATRQAEQFADRYGFDLNVEQLAQGDIRPLERVVHDRFSSEADKVFSVAKREQSLRDVAEVVTLSLFGHMIREMGYAQVDFNDDGDVKFKGMFSMFAEKEGYVVNDMSFGDDELVRLLEAPNMAGKTDFLKALTMGVLSGINTGFLPAESARMPLFQGVLYLDRISHKLDSHLSSLATEIYYWNRFFKFLENRPAAFVVANVDEPISTAPQRYQSSFLYPIGMEIIRAGQYMVVASHNHEGIKVLLKAAGEWIKRFTFGGDAADQQNYHRMREVADDEVISSDALRIARESGMQEEILTIAEMVRDGAYTAAMASSPVAPPGGIDLTTDTLPLETRGEGMTSSPVIFQDVQGVDPAMISGFTPVIIQMTPVTDLPMFLGHIRLN